MAAAFGAYAQPGTIDTSFGTGGYGFIPIGGFSSTIRNTIIQPDNKIVNVGVVSMDGFSTNMVISRFNANGTVDTTFGTGGYTLSDAGNPNTAEGNDVAIQSTGHIVAVGNCFNTATHMDILVTKYTANGIPDQSFGTQGKVVIDLGNGPQYGLSVAIQPDNKIIIVGERTPNNPTFVIRLNIDGSYDQSFGSSGIVYIDFNPLYDNPPLLYQFFNEVALQNDGKIVVAGRSGPYYSDMALARLNTNGSPDTSFGSGGLAVIDGPYIGNKSLILQGDGKILLGAKGTNNVGALYHRILKLNSNGSLDMTFGEAGDLAIAITPYNDWGAITVQPDGKIVAIDVTGSGGIYNKVKLSRFEANGTPDDTFAPDGSVVTEFSAPESFIPRDLFVSNGQLLSSGTVSATSGSSHLGAMRFNGGELLDTNSFTALNFTIYPNPVQNTLIIQNPTGEHINTVSVLDLTGKIIIYEKGVEKINVELLPHGVYFLKVLTNTKSYIQKFIKR